MRQLSRCCTGVAVLLCVACAHRQPTDDANIPGDQDSMTRVRRDNAALRRRVQMLEDRVLRLERDTGVASLGPSDRELPVVRLEPQAAPPPVQALAEPVRGPTDSISLGTRGGPEAVEDDVWDDPSGLQVDPDPPPAAEGTPRSYRLVGTHLVEMTRQEPPPPDKPVRGRKGKGILAEYEDAMAMLKAGDNPGAQVAFDAFVKEHPRHDYADNALYWKGEAAYDQRHYADALAAFTEVVERYAGGNKAPDALLKIGLCYSRLGDADNAKDVLSSLIAAYPGARASEIARVRLAEHSSGPPGRHAATPGQARLR